MKTLVAVCALLLVSYPIGASAIVGVGIGGKVGVSDYSGDVLPQSGDVGATTLIGAMLEISTLPVVDIELHANYAWTEFEYNYTVLSVPTQATFDFKDFHVLALGKINLVKIPASPLGVYVGGGVGWHLLNTEAAKNSNYSLADNPVDMLANTARMSGHGLLGLKVSPPVIPLAIFGEARFGRIFGGDEALSTTQVEGGLMLKF